MIEKIVSKIKIGTALLVPVMAIGVKAQEIPEPKVDLLPQEEYLLSLSETMVGIAAAAAMDAGCQQISGVYPFNISVVQGDNKARGHINYQVNLEATQTERIVSEEFGTKQNKYKINSSNNGMLYSQIFSDFNSEFLFAYRDKWGGYYSEAKFKQHAFSETPLTWHLRIIDTLFIEPESHGRIIKGAGQQNLEKLVEGSSVKSKWLERIQLTRPAFEDGSLSITAGMIDNKGETVCQVSLQGKYNPVFGNYIVRGLVSIHE